MNRIRGSLLRRGHLVPWDHRSRVGRDHEAAIQGLGVAARWAAVGFSQKKVAQNFLARSGAVIPNQRCGPCGCRPKKEWRRGGAAGRHSLAAGGGICCCKFSPKSPGAAAAGQGAETCILVDPLPEGTIVHGVLAEEG